MNFPKTKLVPALAALLMFTAAGTANAAAYGYSHDNIFGLTITNPTGVVTVAANGTTDISRSTATLNGNSVITGGTGFLDAPQAALGAVVLGPNNFQQQGQGGPSYSRGDAQIISTQFPSFPTGATSTQAANVAEAYVAGAGSADASGRNGSTTGFSVIFTVGSPTATLAFNFQADPYMQVFLSALSGAGSSSTANLVVGFSITDAAGNTVFNWSPDGVVGSNIFGGSESADDASLNINLGTNSLTAGNLLTYDPNGCGSPGGTGSGTGCGGNYAAVTAALAAGTYTLTLNAIESVNMTVAQVPEPGTLALMGLGLAGLGFARRRKPA